MDTIVASSRFAYAETIERLTQAIHAAGATLFANIDQRAAAQTAGLDLRPTALLIFGNPKAGTPLMHAFPLVALDLPLKLIVWEADGMVNVAYTSMGVVAKERGVTGLDPLVAALDRNLAALVATVV